MSDGVVELKTVDLAATAQENAEPTQRIVKIRRDYNTWVANESIEDYTSVHATLIPQMVNFTRFKHRFRRNLIFSFRSNWRHNRG